jgi:hypothetical protein
MTAPQRPNPIRRQTPWEAAEVLELAARVTNCVEVLTAGELVQLLELVLRTDLVDRRP